MSALRVLCIFFGECGHNILRCKTKRVFFQELAELIRIQHGGQCKQRSVPGQPGVQGLCDVCHHCAGQDTDHERSDCCPAV